MKWALVWNITKERRGNTRKQKPYENRTKEKTMKKKSNEKDTKKTKFENSLRIKQMHYQIAGL
jgi:hypothetical protein